jgi:hypothetical protein
MAVCDQLVVNQRAATKAAHSRNRPVRGRPAASMRSCIRPQNSDNGSLNVWLGQGVTVLSSQHSDSQDAQTGSTPRQASIGRATGQEWMQAAAPFHNPMSLWHPCGFRHSQHITVSVKHIQSKQTPTTQPGSSRVHGVGNQH